MELVIATTITATHSNTSEPPERYLVANTTEVNDNIQNHKHDKEEEESEKESVVADASKENNSRFDRESFKNLEAVDEKLMMKVTALQTGFGSAANKGFFIIFSTNHHR